MLLDPDAVIALLREQRKSDLALLAVVAMAACTPEELDAGANPWRTAADRLENGARRVREQNRAPRQKPRGHGPARDVLAWIDDAQLPPLTTVKKDLFDRAPRLADRLVPMLRKVADAADEERAPG